MQGHEWLSVAINLLVALYFVRYYPTTQARSFRGRPIPPGFLLLRKVVFWLGWLIILGTAGYTGYRLLS